MKHKKAVMTTKRNTHLTLLLALVLVACADTEQHSRTAADQNVPEGRYSDASASLVELGTASTVGEAFPLAAGSVIQGAFSAPRDGVMTAIAAQIGNYANSADGEFRFEVCYARACSGGTAHLDGSQDNAFLEVMLEKPLGVRADAPVEYRIIRTSGQGPAAVWLYAVNPSQAGAQVNEQKPMASAPRLAIRFAQ
jgi:hypothetical protein